MTTDKPTAALASPEGGREPGESPREGGGSFYLIRRVPILASRRQGTTDGETERQVLRVDSLAKYKPRLPFPSL
ncbi:MAG: hypothetical protein IIW01_04840, partial [Thermoguttaceae bacterium]|nr:hypothetical protein [Thermoguttaceae bacterium]